MPYRRHLLRITVVLVILGSSIKFAQAQDSPPCPKHFLFNMDLVRFYSTVNCSGTNCQTETSCNTIKGYNGDPTATGCKAGSPCGCKNTNPPVVQFEYQLAVLAESKGHARANPRLPTNGRKVDKKAQPMPANGSKINASVTNQYVIKVKIDSMEFAFRCFKLTYENQNPGNTYFTSRNLAIELDGIPTQGEVPDISIVDGTLKNMEVGTGENWFVCYEDTAKNVTYVYQIQD